MFVLKGYKAMLIDLKCKASCDLACKFLFFIAVLTKVLFMALVIKLITLNITSFNANLKWLFTVLIVSDLLGGFLVFKFYFLIRRVTD